MQGTVEVCSSQKCNVDPITLQRPEGDKSQGFTGQLDHDDVG